MIARITWVAAADLASLVRRRWFLVVGAAGIAAIALAAAVATSHDGPARADSFRASAASLLLIGGLAFAIVLGATAISRPAESGHLGLLAASGASRPAIALGRIVARLGALSVALGIWLVALQVASVAIGRGLDGPLAVHTAAAAETHAAVLLGAAAIGTVLGPVVSGLVGLTIHVAAQAVVNLEAAADQGRLGAQEDLVHAAYSVFPRAVMSPMIVDLQNRGEGGAAAPRFEINEIPVPVPAAGIGTVLWTLFWCALFGWLCVVGTQRRTL